MLQTDGSSISTREERVYYIYVNEAVTITAVGKGNKIETPDGGKIYTSTYTTIGIDLNLAKGWNAVYEKITSSHNSDSNESTITRELKAGEPSGIYWTNDNFFM